MAYSYEGICKVNRDIRGIEREKKIKVGNWLL